MKATKTLPMGYTLLKSRFQQVIGLMSNYSQAVTEEIYLTYGMPFTATDIASRVLASGAARGGNRNKRKPNLKRVRRYVNLILWRLAEHGFIRRLTNVYRVNPHEETQWCTITPEEYERKAKDLRKELQERVDSGKSADPDTLREKDYADYEYQYRMVRDRDPVKALSEPSPRRPLRKFKPFRPYHTEDEDDF